MAYIDIKNLRFSYPGSGGKALDNIDLSIEKGEFICLCGVSGSGASLSEALEDMRAHAPGELFLDTAEHIVLRERAWYLLPQAASCRALRPAARLVRAGGELPGIEELRAFLQAHPPALTLAHAYASFLRGEPVCAPQLTQTEGRLSLAG